jgi:hypothetical protein
MLNLDDLLDLLQPPKSFNTIVLFNITLPFMPFHFDLVLSIASLESYIGDEAVAKQSVGR